MLQLTQAAFVEAPYECAIVEVATDDELTVTRHAHALSGAEPTAPDLPVLVPACARFVHDTARWRETAADQRKPDQRTAGSAVELVSQPLT